MPAKNRTKQYSERSYYHIYNRGVEKRAIFLDKQDYGVFLGYLKQYLSPKNETKLHDLLSKPELSYKERDKILKLLRLNNFYKEIELVAYCLMPNHFHFLIYQEKEKSIDRFMNSLATRYTMYFNKKYKRVGYLYQGVYKAVMVTSDPQLLELTRYIHKQALALQGQAWERKRTQPCSYWEYIGGRVTKWVYPNEILKFFSKDNSRLSYETFVAETDNLAIIGKLLLED